MNSLFIKKGDTVYVNAGNDRGKTGRVLRVLVKKNRAVVEGINMVSKSVETERKAPAGRHYQDGSPHPRFQLESHRPPRAESPLASVIASTRKERRYVILKSQERRLSNEFNKS